VISEVKNQKELSPSLFKLTTCTAVKNCEEIHYLDELNSHWDNSVKQNSNKRITPPDLFTTKPKGTLCENSKT